MTTQAQDDEVSDVSIERLVLDVQTRGKHGLSTGIGDLITDGKVEQTMAGASQVELTVHDKGYEALNSGVFKTRVLINLDGVPFRLVEVSLIDVETLKLVFEHSLIAEMREHSKPLKVSRSNKTRAEFILQMLRELKQRYTFICPELHRKQPVAPATAQEVTQKTGELATEGESKRKEHESLKESGRGASAHGGHITVKGQPARSDQVAILDGCLQEASALGASDLAAEALVVALIQEQTVSWNKPGDPSQRGPLSLLDSTVRGIQAESGHGFIDPFNLKEITDHFMTAGFYKYGGAMDLAKQEPTASPSHIGTKVEGPAAEYPSSWNAEAKEIVKQFKGQGLSFSGTGGSSNNGSSAPREHRVTRTKEYEYTRGQPGEPEDTFSCALRLAEEVEWRFFVVGRKSGLQAVYYVQDDDLIKAKPRYIIDPETPGVGKVTFDVELGKRLIVLKSKRKAKPSEAQLEVRLDRWDAPPGTVIELKGYGPGDGKWLVDTIERSLYEASGTVHLRAPQAQVPEPRPETTTEMVPEGGGGSPSGHPVQQASASAKRNLASQHPELKTPVREVVASILTQWPNLQITSTISGNHASHSLHYEGRAADLASGDYGYMNRAAKWIAETMTGILTEGIHNPGLAVKDGKTVDGPSFYSAVWEGHRNHIHVGV